ncbi:hypothetical protein Zmor_008800 [Zophobas morio]|uniref:YTH domain-containing protein n=1 Tax=Zophobas morio TaxID=2755281 RepID=A0AA38HII2_9CUCU|nr:hypothetical protein Zmor_008800 [Zophobas morio]
MADTYSDHMVYLKAFIKWQDSVKYRRERLFCRDFFISPSLHSENWPLVKAVISSGLYPKLAFKKSGHYCTRTEKRVLINNASPLSKVCLSLWLVYDEMVKVRNGHQVRGVTPITPITISLMCGIKVNYPMENYLEIDEWLEFEFPSPHIIYLRKYIETIIKKKLLSPTNALNETDEAALNALAKVLILEDRSANLAIPVGIKQKPKFFELNRPLDSSSDQGDYRAVANAYNTARFARNYPPPSNDQFSLSDTASYYSTNGYQSYDNGNSMLFANSYPGLNVGSRGYQVSPSLSFLNLMDNPSTSGAQALPQPSFPGFENSVFLLIRVKEESSVNIAYSSNKWVFSPQTEKHVMALEKSGKTVFLLYTVPKMNNFYGIARYFCFDESRHRMSAVIEWVFKTVIPYKKVSHLRNSLNHNRLIYDGLDGQVIEMGVAMQLWGMFADSRKSMHGP